MKKPPVIEMHINIVWAFVRLVMLKRVPGTTEQIGDDGVIVVQYHPETGTYTFILNGHRVAEDWLLGFLDELRKWT